MDHLWVPNTDPECDWVYLALPRENAVALVEDAGTLGGLRAVPAHERNAREALAVLVRQGVDTLAITRGHVNGRPAPGGIGLLQHRSSLSVRLREPREGQDWLTLYACADGLIEVFVYNPPADQVVPVLCAVCSLPLEAGEKVRRACPRPGCGALAHADCATAKCPVCSHETADPTGESSLWIPASRTPAPGKRGASGKGELPG